MHTYTFVYQHCSLRKLSGCQRQRLLLSSHVNITAEVIQCPKRVHQHRIPELRTRIRKESSSCQKRHTLLSIPKARKMHDSRTMIYIRPKQPKRHTIWTTPDLTYRSVCPEVFSSSSPADVSKSSAYKKTSTVSVASIHT